MRKLTDRERSLVEENHNLIYSFLHMRDLDVDEYYGLVAESLCNAVMHWEEDRGRLSTFFYRVAISDLYKEWRRRGAKKRINSGELPLDDVIVSCNYFLEDDVIIKETMEEINCSEYAELVDLRLKGYTQEQIAKELGVTQTTISRWLREVGVIYFDRIKED